MEKIAAFFISVIMAISCTGSEEDKKKELPREIIPPAESITTQETAPAEIPAEQPQPEVLKSSVSGKIILIDAGHGITKIKRKEAVAPGSSVTKAAFVSGTSGKYQSEEALNLSVALRLYAKLQEMGAQVYMTRTEHNCDLSNVDRAQLGNNLNADITVRIHADGSNNKSSKGVSVLIPGSKYIQDAAMLEKSKRAGECVLNEFVLKTGAINRGTVVRDDLTGFNWSKVPTILVEMGFMSNPEEDTLLSTADYQDKITEGIAAGLELYFAS